MPRPGEPPDGVFRVLLNLYMVSDPWPLEQEEDDRLEAWLSEVARERGYDGWVHAYHELRP